MPNIRLDLTRITIKPFSENSVTNRFSCGKRPLDAFLKNKAKKATRRYEYSIFCAHIDASPNVIGYYALQLGNDRVDELPSAHRGNYLKNYIAFPAVNLSFLAVDEKYKRQGLGQFLLMDVFSKAASKYAGFYALTLVSLDDDSTDFYQSLGFYVYSENMKNRKMLYPLGNILTLVTQDTRTE